VTDHVEAPPDPVTRVAALLEKARQVEPHDATAMTLATVDERGRPSARVVLLKGVDARGFVFYTNRDSKKGRDLARSPFGALCLHWPASQQQVRIEGRLELTSDDESDAYFQSRPRESQLGAWASRQSEPLASREELEARVAELAARYPEKVPRPPHWGGYRLVPDRIELWFAGPARLHDRFEYQQAADGSWTMTRLNP
jgi:pyridoxamine 5'-phosphate oxidase